MAEIQAQRANRVVEEALEPELPIIDPHHHFWEHPESGPFAHPSYMFEDLLADISSGHNIRATVYLQCGSGYRKSGPEHLKAVGETEFAEAMAQRSEKGESGEARICAGIVSSADLTDLETLDEVLDAHMTAAPRHFRGIRQGAFWHASPEVHLPVLNDRPHLLSEPAFHDGVTRLGRRGFTFETWTYHTQLDEFAAFARAVPETNVILNHLGGPLGCGPYAGRQRDAFEEWKSGMAKLAACENVYVKLGGINMPTNGFAWDAVVEPPGSEAIAAATRDYYLHAIDCFSPARCMFESNFPVEQVAYPTLWNVFKRVSQDFSAEEKAALFHDTARRVYRL